MHVACEWDGADRCSEIEEQTRVVRLGFVDEFLGLQTCFEIGLYAKLKDQRAHSAVLIRHVITYPVIHQGIPRRFHSVPALHIDITIFDGPNTIIQGTELCGNGSDTDGDHRHLILTDLACAVTAKNVWPSRHEPMSQVENAPYSSDVKKDLFSSCLRTDVADTEHLIRVGEMQ